MKFKPKLTRFASWPSLCADVDVIGNNNNNEKFGRGRNKLAAKYRSIFTLNNAEINLKNSPENNSLTDILQMALDEKEKNLIENRLEFISNCVENLNVEKKSSVLEILPLKFCDSSSVLIENIFSADANNSEALNKQKSSLKSSKNNEKFLADLEISKFPECNNPCTINESPFYSIIEEKDETDGHFSKDDSSKLFDFDERLNVKFRRPMPPSSPSAPRSTLHHRLSVPNMSAYRSSSTQDMSRDVDEYDDVALHNPSASDDYFDETNNNSVSTLGPTSTSTLKKHRNVSVSSLILTRNDSNSDKNERRRVSHGDQTSSVDDDEDDDDGEIFEDHLLKSLKSFDRSFSASTPSIQASLNAVENSAAPSKLIQNGEFKSVDQQVPNVQDFVALRNNKSKHSRTPSLYVPSITPRLPIYHLLPGSVRRPTEKSSDGKEKSKDKEKRSFFRTRAKSKEKKPHAWIKVACSNSDLCESCARPLANTDAFQCNECLTSVHSQCKEQVEKMSCAKIKHPKTSKTSANHSSLSMSLPEKPKNLVGRYSSLKQDAILTHRMSEPRMDTSHNLMVVDETPNEYPPGFYAATKPSAHWTDLNLWQEEPEAWSNSYGKTEKKKLSSKETKRQDIIHEMYVTEKHHCQILVVLKHTYYDSLAMQKILSVDDLNKYLPRLDDLLNIHGNFLRLLKQRKDESTIVGALHDVLLAQFTGEIATSMIDAYTKFCSQKDATDRTFQELNQANVPYQSFIKNISSTPFYKSRSLCDCLLLVTQRLSKYHSFVENLRKNTSDDSAEKDGMLKAEKSVKDLVAAVDAGIDKIQLEQFRIKIVQEMDPKSVTPFDKTLFAPKDLLTDERRLVYYTNVQWPNAKRHLTDVTLMLFTDIIVFVQRNHGQTNFFSQDGKAGIISVRKMIVRDKAGKLGSDGVYLIGTYPKPEMYEVRCKTKKENLRLMNQIQKAVENCPTKVNEPAAVIERASSTLITDKEQQELRLLFDKLPETNKKLQSYFSDVLKIYEDISDYVARLAPRIKNNEDKEKLASMVNTCMDSYLNSIHPNTIAANLFGMAAKDKIQQQIVNVLHYDEGETSCSSTSSTSENPVLRSNTFHGRLGNSIRRRALRKHPTISGGIIDSDVRASIVDGGSSCESISENPAHRTTPLGSVKDVTFSLLKHLSDTKVELTNLRENSARLECELALAREQLQHRQRQTANVDNNYHTLEELRNLHASLDKKKNDHMQQMEDKQILLNRREKLLDERDAELSRKDGELHERWEKLVQVWEQQRMNGLPVSPLTGTGTSSSTTSTPPASMGNGELLRRSYSVLTPASGAGQHHPTVVVHRPSVVPNHLSGSLVHGRYPDESQKNVLPVKLKDPNGSSSGTGSGGLGESFSSRLYAIGRNSTKKKWHSTSKLTKASETTSPLNAQMIPNKLASNLNSKKK